MTLLDLILRLVPSLIEGSLNSAGGGIAPNIGGAVAPWPPPQRPPCFFPKIVIVLMIVFQILLFFILYCCCHFPYFLNLLNFSFICWFSKNCNYFFQHQDGNLIALMIKQFFNTFTYMLPILLCCIFNILIGLNETMHPSPHFSLNVKWTIITIFKNMGNGSISLLKVGKPN